MAKRKRKKKTKGPGKSAAKRAKAKTEEDLGPVDRAVLDLLQRVPVRWGPLDSDAATAAEEEALKLLTAGALIERRISLRLGLIGHPMRVEATIIVTGEYGLVEAIEPVFKTAWEEWASDYRRRQAGAEEDKPHFHCERVGDEQARLTMGGEFARKDAESGDVRGLLAWLHRETAVFFGLAVRGHGRAERIRVRKSRTAPVEVKIVNMPDFTALMEKRFSDRASDLITVNVAVQEYETTERTIRSKVKTGAVTDHRPPGHAPNAKLMLSRSELDRLFARKPRRK